MRRVFPTLVVCLMLGRCDLVAQQKPARPATEVERAIEEFKIQTKNLGVRSDSPPKKGKNGGVVQSWHGRVYENLRNDILDAVRHEIRQRGGTKNVLRRNQFGFHVAGPVVIPKLYNGGRNTFFSFSYEGVRERISRTYLGTIPTTQERSGDYSTIVDQAGNLLPILLRVCTSRSLHDCCHCARIQKVDRHAATRGGPNGRRRCFHGSRERRIDC